MNTDQLTADAWRSAADDHELETGLTDYDTDLIIDELDAHIGVLTRLYLCAKPGRDTQRAAIDLAEYLAAIPRRKFRAEVEDEIASNPPRDYEHDAACASAEIDHDNAMQARYTLREFT